MDDIVLAGYGAHRVAHLRDLVRSRAAGLFADGSGNVLHRRLFVELIGHQ